MRFKAYDSLRVFDVVAECRNFTAAAESLHLSKGAISYQISRLEEELGFALFHRQARGVQLTEAGNRLLATCSTAFRSIEADIEQLRHHESSTLTVGMSTYFASRWLSPRLMHFTHAHPHITLRLQPVTGVADLVRENLDLQIRWGNGQWDDVEVTPLFHSDVYPTAGNTLYQEARREGITHVMQRATLLHDVDGSPAWADWFRRANIPYRTRRDALVIPDPNVRVQAVIDGQGIALNDQLVAGELATRQLHVISDTPLDNYGYHLALAAQSSDNPALLAFVEWLREEVLGDQDFPSRQPGLL